MPGWFGALIQRKNGKKMAKRVKNGKHGKIAPEKSAPECPFECGGGCNCYLGNAQIEVVTN